MTKPGTGTPNYMQYRSHKGADMRGDLDDD